MEVNGQKTYSIDQKLLWSYLQDPKVLAQITPGITSLDLLETNVYQSNSDIKLGPVKSVFKGKLTVKDIKEPESFTIQMEQLSRIGNVHADVHMHLEKISESETLLNFDAKARLSGLVARTGQRVLSGVANALTKEVFKSLEEYIDEHRVDDSQMHSTD